MRRFRNALRDPGSAAREMRFLREQYLTRAVRYMCVCVCMLRHEKRARNRIGIRRLAEFALHNRKRRRYRAASIFRLDFSLSLFLVILFFF